MDLLASKGRWAAGGSPSWSQKMLSLVGLEGWLIGCQGHPICFMWATHVCSNFSMSTMTGSRDADIYKNRLCHGFVRGPKFGLRLAFILKNHLMVRSGGRVCLYLSLLMTLSKQRESCERPSGLCQGTTDALSFVSKGLSVHRFQKGIAPEMDVPPETSQ